MKILTIILIIVLSVLGAEPVKASTKIMELDKNDPVALVSMAYLVRKDPWALEKLGDSNLTSVFKKYKSGFSPTESIEDLFVQIGNYCILKTNQEKDSCSFISSKSDAGNLFLSEPAIGDGSMLMFVSFSSPERTFIFKWNTDVHAALLYDSFLKKNTVCRFKSKATHLRVIKKIEYLGGNQFNLLDQGNMQNELKRTVSLKLNNGKCELQALREKH